MKKVFTLSKYLVICFIFSYYSRISAQDFKVQHIQNDIANTGGTNTSITPVSNINSAFVLPNNNRKTHAGNNGFGTALHGDDLSGARVLTDTNTLTYYRQAGSEATNMRFNSSIWEYTGAVGGPNEFRVISREVFNLKEKNNFSTQFLASGWEINKNKCVPFITGIINDNGGGTQDADSGTAIAYLSSLSNFIWDPINLNVLKGSNNNDVTVYVTVVEFTGSNWTVLHGDSGSVAADTGSITLRDGAEGTGTETNVNAWDESIIFSQHLGDTDDTNGINDARSDNWPLMAPGTNNHEVNWTFHSDHDSSGTNRQFVHVLSNPDITVTRFQDTSNTANESTLNITSAGLSDKNQALIVGSSITSGTDDFYAKGWRNYYLNSTTEAAHWCHIDGDNMSHEIQIINLIEPVVETPEPNSPGGVGTRLQLWLKANEGVEEAANDAAENLDPVLNWVDQTQHNNTATQNTVTNQPIFTENAINFNPVIDFDGINHNLLSTITPAATMTVFAVAEGRNTTTKHLLNLNGGGGAVSLAQTNATTVSSDYSDGTSSGNINTTITNGAPFLLNYDFISGSNSQLFNNGISAGTTSTNAYILPATVTAGIGTDPTTTDKIWDGGIAELIVYNKAFTTTERNQVESYLAIKYGFTLGVNGTSKHYVDSDGTTIWDQSANSGYNYNIIGIGQDNHSLLNQKQSKTINTTNAITIGLKTIATNNNLNTNSFFADKTFLMCGNNNGATSTTTTITKDFGLATGATSTVTATAISRTWKIVVKDSVPTIKLSLPKTMVSSANPGDTNAYIMIISDDDTFTTNVTSRTMKIVGTELETDFYFEGIKYITFGATEISPEVSRSVSFDRSDMYLTAGNVNDLANIDFTISAWVKRNPGTGKFDVVSKRNYYNEDTVDLPGTYTSGYAFRINSNNKLRMVWKNENDPVNHFVQTTSVIPENEWHHVAATYDSSTNTTRLFIDGFLEDEDDTLSPISTPTDAHFLIGAAHHIKRQQRLNGSVDEVRVWNTNLSGDQIRYIMNQEIENNSSLTNGKTLPLNTLNNEIKTVPWSNLIAYYPMSRLVFGSIKDESDSGNDLSMINYNHLDYQTAPLPYKTTQDGAWDDSTTWVNGDVQYLPGVDSFLPGEATINHNIVEINNVITMDNSNTTLIPTNNNENRTVLGLIVNNSGDLQINGDTDTNTGYALTVSHYLKINGTIDLEGESQLIQIEKSDFDSSSVGTLERDQQGTPNTYVYNYWSSPVAINSNTYYKVTDVFSNITFLKTGHNGSTTPNIQNADYWIWKYANSINNNYSQWKHVRSTDTIYAGEGFTMKGPGIDTPYQNYVFNGKPNNGDINLTISAENDYLIGNPYPSALDADEFIKDNLSSAEAAGRNINGNIINGALYFWDHFAVNSHALKDYQGGYATYTLMGGVKAVSTDNRINASGVEGTKIPERFIPIGQGFFVSAILDADLVDEDDNPIVVVTQPVVGGSIVFKNSQRVFQKESITNSNSGSLFLKSNSNNKTNSKSKIDTRSKIRLMFHSPNGYHRQLLIGADENTSNNFDIGYDAILNDPNKEDMYWTLSSAKLVIQAVNNFNDNQNIPFNIKIHSEGIASISIDDLKNIDASKSIFVHDKKLNLYHDLTLKDYEIFLTEGEHTNRFEITFSINGDSTLGTNSNSNNSLEIFFSNNKQSIIINNPKLKTIQSLKMYNILGQIVFELEKKNNLNYLEFKTEQITSGAYIIKLKTEQKEFSKKVLVK